MTKKRLRQLRPPGIEYVPPGDVFEAGVGGVGVAWVAWVAWVAFLGDKFAHARRDGEVMVTTMKVRLLRRKGFR